MKLRTLRYGTSMAVIGLLTGGAALLAGGTAYAQQAPVAPQEETVSQVGDIVVTAQKRAEPLQDVPVSITVVSSENLERSGVTRLEDLSRVAPSVQISRTGIYTQPAIRGITTAQANAPENNVAIYVDGFYMPSSRGLNMDLVNIQQVEVLKGPQGTLFGRNATGGAILIETLKPSFDEMQGRFSASYGSFNDSRAQAFFSAPLSDTVAVSVAGHVRESDGYIKDISGFDTAPQEAHSLSGTIRYQPNDQLQIIASLGTNEFDDGRGLAITHEGRSLANILFPGGPVEAGRNRTSLNHPVINRSSQDYAKLMVEYDFDWATLTSRTFHQDETNFTHYEIDGSPRPIYDQYLTEDYVTTSQEFNLASNLDGPVQFVAGLFYFDSMVDQHDNFVLSFPSTTYFPAATFVTDTEAYAVYGDVTWQVTDRLFLTGGLRYSRETKDTVARSGAGAIQTDQSATFESTTPRLVARYALDEDSNVYASFSQGFKSGLINPQAPFTVVRPETIDAFEIGYKTARDRYRFDAAAFYYDYTDLQVSSVLVINGVQNAVVANAATAEIYGAEAQFSASVTENFDISAGLAYTHARFKSFPNAPVSLPNPVTGLNSATCPNPNAPPATVICTQDFSGLRMSRAPDWTGTISGAYRIPLTHGEITLSGNVSYTSFFVPTRSDRALNGSGYRYGEDGGALVNLQASWAAPGERWQVTVYGTNITDERNNIVRTGSAFGDYRVEGEPAAAGVRLDYRF